MTRLRSLFRSIGFSRHMLLTLSMNARARGHHAAGHEGDAHGQMRRGAHDLRVEVHADHGRHHQLAQDEVERLAGRDELQGLPRARGARHVGFLRDCLRERVAHEQILVDDEDAPLRDDRADLRGARPIAVPPGGRERHAKEAPLTDGAEGAESPPSHFTTPCAIERPRPMPVPVVKRCFRCTRLTARRSPGSCTECRTTTRRIRLARQDRRSVPYTCPPPCM